MLWDHNARNAERAVRPDAQQPPGVDRPAPVDNVRAYAYTDHPWLAADPTLGPWQPLADFDVVQTGAWLLHDERPLAAELAGVPRRRHAAGVPGLRQHARAACQGARPGGDRGDPRPGPAGAALARLGRAWPSATTVTTALPSARSISKRCSDGWRPSCTTAARARRRRPPGRARLRWWCPRGPTSCTGPAGWPTWASAPRMTVRLRPRVPAGRARAGPGRPRPAHEPSAVAGHDPHRRRDGGRDAAAGRDEPRKIALAR